MKVDDVLERLGAIGSEQKREGMTTVGINTESARGTSVPELRALAKDIGRDHDLALALWQTGIHEARMLSALLADPARMEPKSMDDWVEDFDSCDLCDHVCGNLFDRTRHAWVKAVEWSGRDEVFVKRAGFALMAWLAVHDKQAGDADFLQFLPIIEAEADDRRDFVRNGISWAVREIGKRSDMLEAAATETIALISDHASSKLGTVGPASEE